MGDVQVPPPNGHEPIADLVPVIRRVVAARIHNPAQIDDIVQETLSRVMAARSRVQRDTLAPYAVATARNLITSGFQREQRARQSAHLLAGSDDTELRPEDEAVRKAEAAVVNLALSRLPQADREILLEHEVEGRDTATLAAGRGTTPGAVAARLARTRARLRVEYLLAQSTSAPVCSAISPTADDRPNSTSAVISWRATSAQTSARACSSIVRAGPVSRRSGCRCHATPMSSSYDKGLVRPRRAPASPEPI